MDLKCQPTINGIMDILNYSKENIIFLEKYIFEMYIFDSICVCRSIENGFVSYIKIT
jgi:hypothetical protein